MSTPLRQPRRTFLYIAFALAVSMVVLLALGYVVPALVVGVLTVACVFAGARATGGA